MREPKKYITIKDILKLFEKRWGLKIGRTNVYFYIRYRGFPKNTGRGMPRLWEKNKVDKFFSKNN